MLSKMCDVAKIKLKTINGTFRSITPLKIKIQEGRIDNHKALAKLFFFQNIAQQTRYVKLSKEFTIIYVNFAFINQKLKYVHGTLKTMKNKHP